MNVQNLQVLRYEDKPVTFDFSADVMVNATQMAKCFNKQVHEWLRLPSTKEYIDALKETKGFSLSLVETREGRNGGTWMHRSAAIEFARWCSPKFGVWCNEQILNHYVDGNPMDKPVRKPSKQVSSRVVRAHYAAIEEKKRLLNLSDASIAKMINTTDKVLGIEGQLIEYVPSKGVLKSITELLKKYNVNMSAMAANKKLASLGILEQHSRKSNKGFKNFWVLTKRGLEYGQNEVNPNNPKETQPLYFEDKFSSLLTNF